MSTHAANTASAFPSRQTPRLQNTSKTPLSNGAGWAFGMPGSNTSASSAVGAQPNGMRSTNGFGSGLGGGRPAQLSGFAQVMGGGGIDMSDFPSLSGGQQPAANATQSTWNSGILRSQSQQRPGQTATQQLPPLTQQRVPSAAPSQQSIDPQQHVSSEQEGEGGDDFPPLSGQSNHANGDIFATTASLRSLEGPAQHQNSQAGRTVLPFRDGQAGVPLTGAPSQTALPQSSTSATQTAAPRPPASVTKRYIDMTENEKYGLEGLAAAYEARKALENGQMPDETLPPIMRSGLFFGQDLNSLGMDLDTPDPIWPTFTAFPASTSQAQGAGAANGIFDFHDRAIVPEFTLPPAYTVNNVPLLASRLGSLSDETLFCIFYQNPRDLLQEQAAEELTARDWRWHKVLRQWLQKDTQHSNANNSSGSSTNTSLPIIDLTNGAPVGVLPQRVSPGIERGIYVFFDVMNWRRERREFVLAYDELDQRFTPEMGMVGGANIAAGMAGGAGGPVLPSGRMDSS